MRRGLIPGPGWPMRRALPIAAPGTGAANRAPHRLSVVTAIVDIETGVGIAVVRDVGDRPLGAAERDAALISGFGFNWLMPPPLPLHPDSKE